jgi:hypothetical protein
VYQFLTLVDQCVRRLSLTDYVGAREDIEGLQLVDMDEMERWGSRNVHLEIVREGSTRRFR